MKRIFVLVLLFVAFKLNAQVGPNLYYLEFTDKNNSQYTLDNPQEFLSERAINRRIAQNIAIDSLDLPVNESYIQALVDLGLEIHNVSKWFNSAVVRTEDYNLVLQARNLPFVKDVANYEIDTTETRTQVSNAKINSNMPNASQRFEQSDYGRAYMQIVLHNGQLLHSEGYKGEGMLIAVTDGGFTKADEMPSLAYLRDNNRIVATRDFAYGDGNVYDHHTHGSMVLALMAGYLPGEYIGTAPEAEYLLITSECDDYEEIVEELNWVSAIEYADSMGADVANVSLGYVDFDSPRYNHAYEDMNGMVCPSSVAAKIAASRGMMIVVAAGNSGMEESGHVWIGAPSDADDIVSVGAISWFEAYAPFSSQGFCDGDRIKPDITSVGWGTYVDYTGDSIAMGNGTSFATPIMCGLITCFWQKFYEKTNMEIRNTIFEATRPTNPYYEDITTTTGTPNIYTGRGVVDFAAASELLTGCKTAIPAQSNVEITTNPMLNTVTIQANSNDSFELNIFSSDGRLLDYRKGLKESYTYDLSRYTDGMYIVSISIDNKVVATQKVIR